MSAVQNINDLIAVKGDKEYIGKLVYFTLGNTLIKEAKIQEIADNCGIDKKYLVSKYTETHAFKTATKDMEQRYIWDRGTTSEIYKIRILDNAREDDGHTIVREIKKEIVDERQNKMLYLGNFILYQDAVKNNLQREKEAAAEGRVLNSSEKEIEIECAINPTAYDEVNFDLQDECKRIMALYEYAKDCYNDQRIITFVENYINEVLDASKVSIHGKLFFIPAYKANELAKLEQFFEEIQMYNQASGLINFAAIPVMNEEKFIKEYTKEYYAMAEEEIEIYRNRLQHFMEKDGNVSEKIVNAWIDKIQRFIDKKANYEETFQNQLSNIDDDIMLINRQVRELQIRIERQRMEELSNKSTIDSNPNQVSIAI